jgi:uncharacterized delta-60 repeat protein
MTNPSLNHTLYRLTAALAIVATAATAAAQNLKTGVAHFDWNGALVPSFGGDGLVTTDFPPAIHSWARAMTIDTSGRLIVAGGNSQQLLIACFNRATGALDPTFGIGGYVYLTTYSLARANAVAIDPLKGDIIVAGIAGSNFLVARYSREGLWLDDVQTTFEAGSVHEAYALAIDAQGRIVAAGSSIYGPDGRIALARYLPNLTLDSTFDGDGNNDGRILTNLRANSQVSWFDREQANGIAFQGSSIVVAGHTAQGDHLTYAGEFLVLRYKTSGALDPTFDGDGITVPFTSMWTGYDQTFRANAVAVDSSGRILAAGRASANRSGPHFALVRLNGNGSLDTTFSGDGKALTNFGWSGTPSEALAIALRGTSIVLAGWTGSLTTSSVVLARYNSNGTLDMTFDGDGRAAANFCQDRNVGYALAIWASSGRYTTLPRIYVAGWGSGEGCS